MSVVICLGLLRAGAINTHVRKVLLGKLSSHIMATLLPPPKRQKLYHGVPEPQPEPVRQTPNVVVQFVAEDDGKPLAPAVSIPANTPREGLELLLNTLTKVSWMYMRD